ncbi:MAG: HD domain-containing protein [Gammaproteobacteria bacterium]|nr:HD domain-containing protein [Gammaproteobacteria bacterium]
MSEEAQPVNETHYVNHLRKAGEQHEIKAHEDVYSESGLKLISKNVTIDDELYDKLMQHKLLKPLDLSISVGDSLTVATLQDDFDQMFRSDALMSAILEHSQIDKKLIAILKNIKFPDSIAGKLTVMRTSDPDLYRHSLCTSLLAAYSGVVCGFGEKECIILATAGLLHDMGMLHIDPSIPTKKERLDLNIIKQISAHPIIAFMILQNFEEFRPFVTAAVVEHHERNDATGYPHQLDLDKLSPYGKVMAIVEVIASIYSKTGSIRLALTVIRTRMEHYDPEYLSDIITALLPLQSSTGSQDELTLRTNITRKLIIIHEAMNAWQQPFMMVDAKDAIKSPASLVTIRLETMKISMIRCGLINTHLEHVGELNIKSMLEQYFDNDPQYLAELSILVDDHIYQLVELIREVLIRWPLMDADIKQEKDTPLINWIVFIDSMLGNLPSNLMNRR